jgi:dolichol-phosphate mannosyltransferase
MTPYMNGIEKYCVLLATYNEADTIAEILNILNNKFGIQVVVVDDNSPDGTAEIARKFPQTHVIVRTNKRGIASAYIDGFQSILQNYNYEYIIQMDAGMTHDPYDVLKMIRLANDKNALLVIGSRNIDKQKIQGFRTVLSKTARILMKLIGVNQTDVTSGFRCWNTTLLKKIDFDFIDAKGFAFQLQMLYNANYLTTGGKGIAECPIKYQLTNSSLNWKIILEAAKIWFKLFYIKMFTNNKILKDHYGF